MVSLDVSPLLEWAYVILQWALNYVWIICLLVAVWILYHGAFKQADFVVKGKEQKVSRIKE